MKTILNRKLLLLLSIFCLVACSEKEEENSNPIGTSSLQVTPGKLSFTAAGGTQLLTVKTTYPKFGYSESSEWLDADFKDDPTYNYIMVTAEPNTKSEARSTTVRIDGADENSKIVESVNVKVEQEAGNGDTGTEFTVSPNGGTVEEGDIAMNFSEGTFKSNTNVAVSEVEKGFIGGEMELSKFYKVKLSAGVRRGFTVAVKMPKLSDERLVRMQFSIMGWAPSTNEHLMIHRYMGVKYTDGAYVAEIPEMESPDDAGETEVYFGVTTCDLGEETSSARTRADNMVVRTDYGLYKYLLLFSDNKFKDIFYNMRWSWIPEAMDQLEKLGFKKEEGSKIEYYLVNLGENHDGCCLFNPWGKKYSEIYLNYTKLKDKDYNYIRQTIIHETFHYYQQFYDTRSAPRYAVEGYSTATILEEASSVWSERYYGFKIPTLSEQTQSYANIFVPSINPVYTDIADVPAAQAEWKFRFTNVGYGAGTLLEYLTQKYGEGIIKELWEDRKTGDPFDTRGRIEKIAKKHGLDIFTQSAYKDFLEAIGTRKVYPPTESMHFDVLINHRQKHDTIGELRKTVKDIKPVYFTNYVYGYGALIEELTISKDFNNNPSHGLDNVNGMIEQTKEGLKTWVYRLDQGGQYTYCGVTKKGAPLAITNDWFRKTKEGNYADCKVYMMTIADDFKTSKEILSRTVVQMAEFPNFTQAKLDYCYNTSNGDAICHWIPASGTSYYADGEDWVPVTTTFNPKDSTVTIVGSGTLPKYATPGGEDHTNSASQTYSFKFVMDIRKWGASTVDNRQFTGNVTWTTTSNTTYKSGRWNKDERTVSFSLKPVKLMRIGDANASEIEFATVAKNYDVFNSYSETLVTSGYRPPIGEDPEEHYTETENFTPASGCDVPFTIHLYTESKNTTRRRTKSRR